MKRLSQKDSGLTAAEHKKLAALRTPSAIQDFLDRIPMNFEKKGDTHYSTRNVLKEKKAHCIEGALLAAAALWINGEPPLIMNVSARMGRGDDDHVVTLYRRGGCWGAISKTNHATIRFRDPVYASPRELALSYFHEWFMNDGPHRGEKTLECYSKPLDMRTIGTRWLTDDAAVWKVDDALASRKHYFLVPKGNWRYVRKADAMELKAGKLLEWKSSDPRT